MKAIIALAAAAALATGFVVTQVPTATAADDHAAHAMTPAEHLGHMAAAGDIHAGHALDEIEWATVARQAAPASANLPADDMSAAERLAKSPRKSEFVTVTVNGTPMRAFVVHPQGSGPAPVVVVIQEIFGLSDWIRAVADQLAAEGFIAVAPDLLAGRGPNGGDSTSFSDTQAMMKATLGMPANEVLARIKAARDLGLKQPRANGKSASVGFCFGGAQSFALAADDPSLSAAVVYYGQAPGGGNPFMPADSLANIKAPVLGLYGGIKEDARIGATIAPTQEKMKQLGKVYEAHIFDGAQHGFLRAQTAANGANMKAAQQAWPLTVAWIRKYAS